MSAGLTTQVEAFFGDGKHVFKLTAPMIVELERNTGAGIGGLCKRVFANDYRLHDISEVIRLALIGGGEKPETALALVKAYVEAAPLSNSLPLALTILEALFFGVDPLTIKEPA